MILNKTQHIPSNEWIYSRVSRSKASKFITRLYITLLEAQRYNNIQNYYNRIEEILYYDNTIVLLSLKESTCFLKLYGFKATINCMINNHHAIICQVVNK